MIKSFIIEDEARGRETLINYLRRYCVDVDIIGTAEDVTHAIEQVISLQPELIFLDISLPDGTGFDVLEKISHLDFELIFVTAYGQYALDAIKKSNCVDYLVKPISIVELQKAVEKAKANIDKKADIFILRQLGTNSNKITIPTMDKYEIIEIDDIVYCKADKSWTIIHLKDGKKHVCSKNLKTFEKVLIRHNFFRTHRSYLVNLAEITSFGRGRNGKAILSNGDEIEVSELKKQDFLKRWNIV